MVDCGRCRVNPLPTDQDHTGRSLDQTEISALTRVIESGVLFAPRGTQVAQLELEFGQLFSDRKTVACSSGTAAIHAAVAALDLEPGDEIVTTGVTDMGALTPILYQGVIPVFADVDPESGNVTAQSIADRISDRTRAVIVTHLFGVPADIADIVSLAHSRDLKVIEDCAQAFLATVDGEYVGTFGDVACFSLQQGKHITSGEGGLIVTDDETLAHHMRLFINKGWDYDEPSDHDFLALNYRMSELQGAVARAQLAKLAGGVRIRQENAELLRKRLRAVDGVTFPGPAEGSLSSHWRIGLLVDHDEIQGGPEAMAAELRDLGVPAAARYTKKPAFRCGVFANQKTLGESSWPFTLARPEAVDYDESLFKGTFEFLDSVLVIPWNERLTAEDIDRLADAVTAAAASLSGRKP